MVDANNTIMTGINFFDKIFSGVLTDIILAILILLVGFIIGKVVGRLLKKFLNEFKLDKAMKKSLGIKISLENFLSSFISYSIFILSIILALNKVGVTAIILNILSIAAAILIIITTILAFKDSIPNFFAGIRIVQKDMAKKGDIISFDKVTAKVVEVTMTETKLESKSGDIIFIPNSLLLKKIVTLSGRKKL